MNNFKMKKRGFTLIEMLIIIAIISILIGVGVAVYTNIINIADEKVCHIQCQGAIQLYKTYTANGGEIDIDDTTGTEFLVVSGFLNKEYECPNGGVYTWNVDNEGNVSISCSIHGENEDEDEDEELIKPTETPVMSKKPIKPIKPGAKPYK